MALNTNTTLNTTFSTYLNKTTYDRAMLAYARTKFLHAKYGQKRRIPKRGGKTVEFRRWSLFDPALAIGGLTEGVTPDGQSLGQTNVTATIAQYGAYVTISDLLDKTAIDDAMGDCPELLGEQMGTVIEWVTRNAMCAGTNVRYAAASGVTPTNRLAVTSACLLTVDDVRKAARTLRKNKARMFNGTENGGKKRPGHFLCIVSPDTVYDLQNDSWWRDVSKYSNAEAIYEGELGKMFGVVFLESTEAQVYKAAVSNAVKTATSSSTEFVLRDEPTAAEVAYLSAGGNKIYVGSTEYTLASTGSYTESTKTVKLSEAASLTANAAVYTGDAGASGIDIHGTLVFGKDAYGTIDIDGDGAIRSIVKPFGSGGTSDPLNQRATVGAKVPSYATTILNNDWIVRVEHAVTTN